MVKHISGGGSSYVDAMRKAALHLDVKPSRSKCLYLISNLPNVSHLTHGIHENDDATNSEIVDEFEQFLFSGKRGGSIVFSTDVNATQFSEKTFVNWLIKKFYTLRNRFTIMSFLRKLRVKKDIKAWTIGRYLTGSYTGQDGTQFDETSMVIDIIDIDRKTLFDLAQEIRAYLKQEAVLVKDAEVQQIYFVT